MSRLGDLILLERTRQKLTRKQVARKCGVSEGYIKDVEEGDTEEYRIVGSTEADPLGGRISDESPVGHALVGHRKGDEVEVETPGGVIKLVVEDIAK